MRSLFRFVAALSIGTGALLCVAPVALAECPGSLPSEFEEAFGPGFRESFKSQFMVAFTNGFLSEAGVPNGWTGAEYGAFASEWWGRNLNDVVSGMMEHFETRALEILREDPMCRQIVEVVYDPDAALLGADPATLDPATVARREAALGRLAVFQEAVGGAMAPLMAEAETEFVSRVGEERLGTLAKEFVAEVERTRPGSFTASE